MKLKKRPVVFGIIGAGEITRMVAPMLTAEHGIQVAAIANRNSAAAEGLARSIGGATVHSDFREVLANPAIEAVYIATPPHLHASMIGMAISAGKHVVCEKPFVTSLGELKDLEAAARENSELMIASCSSRFEICPPVRAARACVASRQLGKIQRVRLSNAMPPPMPLAKLPEWKRNRTTGGGGLMVDWGVYDLDWMQFVLGNLFDPIEIFGQMDCWGHEEAGLETSFSAEIKCGSGIAIGWERRSEFGPSFQRAEIRGSEGGVDLPFMPGGSPDRLTRYFHDLGGKALSEPLSGLVGEWGPILAHPILDLANAIGIGCQVASPIWAQRQIHTLIEAFYASAVTGKSVSLV